MKLLIVRHAIAEDRALFALKNSDDDKRPLTHKGRKRMRQSAKGLSKTHPELEYLISSPLTRAVQTANILSEYYPYAARKETKHLAPGAPPEAVADFLASLPADANVALVGHEPDLSELIAWLCTGSPFGFIYFKKGAACLLDIVGKPGPSRAEIEWFLAPRQLRELAV